MPYSLLPTPYSLVPLLNYDLWQNDHDWFIGKSRVVMSAQRF
ncbi:hypothetical protein [Moorena sp. SIO4G3]|nr:hypothetical protein [Moorena sp. SIO4G3]